MASPARNLCGRVAWNAGISLVACGLLAIVVGVAHADDKRLPAVGGKPATVASTVLVLPFVVCPGCPLPGVLTGMQIDPADAVKVHTALGARLDAEAYASVLSGRATLTQVAADKPSRLDVIELYGRGGMLAQAVRGADGSYEVAIRRPMLPAGQREAGSPVSPVWGTKIFTNPADGSPAVILATRSVGSLLEGTGDDLPGMLAVRCLQGRVTTVITWPRFLGLRKGLNVDWKLDAGPWMTEYWALSTDGRALQGPWTTLFLKRLYAAKQLAVRVTPYGMPAQTLEFRLDGLEQDAAPLREACNIK